VFVSVLQFFLSIKLLFPSPDILKHVHFFACHPSSLPAEELLCCWWERSVVVTEAQTCTELTGLIQFSDVQGLKLQNLCSSESVHVPGLNCLGAYAA